VTARVLAFPAMNLPPAIRARGEGDMPAELWRELGATMQRVRKAHGLSLRQVEAMSGWGRGTLSQVENGKGRPSRGLVEWYEATLHTDGLLVALYIEARAAHSVRPGRRLSVAEHHVDGDAMIVVATNAPSGLRVEVDERLSIGWTIENCGDVPWRGRQLRRIGAYAGARLLSSAPTADVPDTAPGQTAAVIIPAVAPRGAGTAVAYWRMVDNAGRYCFPIKEMLALTLVVDGDSRTTVTDGGR
jgi:transcriptional regulator with XRE-family HTH domain